MRGEFTAVRTAETVLSICHSPNYRKTVFLFQLLRENRRNIYSPSLILSTRALQYTSIIKLSAGKCLGEHWFNFSLETFYYFLYCTCLILAFRIDSLFKTCPSAAGKWNFSSLFFSFFFFFFFVLTFIQE